VGTASALLSLYHHHQHALNALFFNNVAHLSKEHWLELTQKVQQTLLIDFVG